MDTDAAPPLVHVLLGLGANLGDPAAQLARAVELLRAHVEVDRVSGVYRSEPVGHADQPDFWNVVVAARTRLDAADLLMAVQAVEEQVGRRATFPNGPRVIDVDLLAYGGRVMRTRALTLPHPRLHLRGFVLHPLAEVAPAWRHPVLGRTAEEMIAAAAGLERVERVERVAPPSAPSESPARSEKRANQSRIPRCESSRRHP